MAVRRGRIEGQLKVLNPNNNTFEVQVGDSGGSQTIVASTDGKSYYISTKDDDTNGVLAALEAAINANATLNGTYTVTGDFSEGGTGMVTVTADETFSLTWTVTEFRDLLGFTGNTSGSASYTGTNQCRSVWMPDCSKRTPMGDHERGFLQVDRRGQISATGVVTTIGGSEKRFNTHVWPAVSRARTRIAGETTDTSWERFWRYHVLGADSNTWALNQARFRIHDDADNVDKFQTIDLVSNLRNDRVDPLLEAWNDRWRVSLDRYLIVDTQNGPVVNAGPAVATSVANDMDVVDVSSTPAVATSVANNMNVTVSAAAASAASAANDATSVNEVPATVVGTDSGNSTGSTDITLTLPGGTAVGDLMVMACGQNDASTADGQIDTPTSGGTWTELESQLDNIPLHAKLRVFYRVVAAAEPNPIALFTELSAGNDNQAFLVVLTDAATAPVNEGTDTTSNTQDNDIAHTEDVKGFTLIAGVISNSVVAVNIDGSIDDGVAFTELIEDTGTGVTDGAAFLIYRKNANRGAQTSGVHSSSSNNDHAIRSFQVDNA